MKHPVQNKEGIVFYYLSLTGYELGESFKSWEEVEQKLFKELDDFPHHGVLALVHSKVVEEKINAV